MSKLIFSVLLLSLLVTPVAAAKTIHYPASTTCLKLAKQRLAAGPYPGKKSGFILEKIKHLQKNNCFISDKPVRANSKLCYKLAAVVKQNWRKESKLFNSVILPADKKYQTWKKTYHTTVSRKIRSKALTKMTAFKKKYINKMRFLQQTIANSRIDGQDYLVYENVKRSGCAIAHPGAAFVLRKNLAAFYIASFVSSAASSKRL